MKNKKLIAVVLGSLMFLPMLAQAAEAGGRGSCKVPTNIESLFELALCVLDGYIVPFLIALGLAIFLVGVVSYVRSGDNEEKRTAGRDMMWYGIISLFVMIGVWGFVNILFNTFFGSDAQFSSLPKQSTSVFQK